MPTLDTPLPRHVAKRPSADLHNHLGASVRPSILWSIAHRQGIRLPSKDYWAFENMLIMTGDQRNANLQEMNDHFFHWTELIQSSPEAIEESVKAVIDGGYRKGNIVLHELRFDPMKRNRSGERDLDSIILSAVWGMDKALLEYPQVRAGLILMMDRSFTPEQNAIIVDKAIKYHDRGIIGIDLAGPNQPDFDMTKVAPLFAKARAAGLGLTVHTGEEGSLDEMRYVVDTIRPERIGHGVLAHQDDALLRRLVEQDIMLEICPTSNLKNSVFKDVDEMRTALKKIVAAGVKFCICTDGPVMYKTHTYQEENFLIENGILTEQEVTLANAWAFAGTFLK